MRSEKVEDHSFDLPVLQKISTKTKRWGTTCSVLFRYLPVSRFCDFSIIFSIILVFPGFLVCRRSWTPQLYCESALISASVCVAFLLLACRCSAASPPPTAETVGKASRWRFLACRNRNMEICQGPQQTRGRGGHRGPLSEQKNRDFTPAKRTFQRNLRGEKERRKERKKEERGDRNRPPTGPHAQDQNNKRVRENPSLRQLFRIFLVSRKRFWLISGAQSQQIGPILCRNGAGPWAHPLARVSASTTAENGRTNGRNRI